jgi:hypothetical protein
MASSNARAAPSNGPRQAATAADTCQQISAAADVEVGIALHDGLQQRADAGGRQQLQRLHQGRVVAGRIGTGRDDVGQHRFDVLVILQLHQLRQHHALGARPIVVPTRSVHRPAGQHLCGQSMGLVPARMVRFGSALDPGPDHAAQRGQRGRKTCPRDQPQPLRMRPQHQGRALVAALERGAFVAGGLVEVLFVRLHVGQRFRRADLAIVEWQGAHGHRAAVGPSPIRQGQGAIEDLGDPELVIVPAITLFIFLFLVIVVVAAAPASASVAVVLCRTTLFDVQQRHVQIARGSARDRGQHGGSSGICALERSKRQFGRRVGVSKGVDQLERPVFIGLRRFVAPRAQHAFQRSRFLVVRRRPGQTPAALAPQVVDEHQPAPRGDGQHLVHAVGIERGPGQLGKVRAAQIEAHFAFAMTDHQFTAAVQRRQRDDQRAEHPGRLFGVAMVEEEAALVVDQKLVQLGLNPGTGAEPNGCAFDDAIQHRLPVPALDANAIERRSARYGARRCRPACLPRGHRGRAQPPR